MHSKISSLLQESDGDDHDDEWYIDSGSSRHMTDCKNNLKNFLKLKDVGMVIFENNERAEVKGCKEFTNGHFTVKIVAYVKVPKHNLINVCNNPIFRHKFIYLNKFIGK